MRQAIILTFAIVYLLVGTMKADGADNNTNVSENKTPFVNSTSLTLTSETITTEGSQDIQDNTTSTDNNYSEVDSEDNADQDQDQEIVENESESQEDSESETEEESESETEEDSESETEEVSIVELEMPLE
jgi:hypothetical protein